MEQFQFKKSPLFPRFTVVPLNKIDLLSTEPWAAAKKKKVSVSVVVTPAPVRILSQRPLAPSVELSHVDR